jgi:hypothetical protein
LLDPVGSGFLGLNTAVGSLSRKSCVRLGARDMLIGYRLPHERLNCHRGTSARTLSGAPPYDFVADDDVEPLGRGLKCASVARLSENDTASYRADSTSAAAASTGDSSSMSSTRSP